MSLNLLYVSYSRLCKINLQVCFFFLWRIACLIIRLTYVSPFSPGTCVCALQLKLAPCQDTSTFSFKCHDLQWQRHYTYIQNSQELLTWLLASKLLLQQPLGSVHLSFEVHRTSPQTISSFSFPISQREFQPRKTICSFPQLPQPLLCVPFIQPCSHLGII